MPSHGRGRPRHIHICIRTCWLLAVTVVRPQVVRKFPAGPRSLNRTRKASPSFVFLSRTGERIIMKIGKLIWIVVCLCGLGVAQEKTTTDASQPPALTIYNQNFFVAREYLPLDLKAGVNYVDYAGIAAHLEPDSVILRDPAGRTAANPRAKLSQRSYLARAAAFALRRQNH